MLLMSESLSLEGVQEDDQHDDKGDQGETYTLQGKASKQFGVSIVPHQSIGCCIVNVPGLEADMAQARPASATPLIPLQATINKNQTRAASDIGLGGALRRVETGRDYLGAFVHMWTVGSLLFVQEHGHCRGY